MGSVGLRVATLVIAISVILLGALTVPVLDLIDNAEAAPNPIPICSVSLYPTERRATVDDETGDTVTFDGNCTVDQLEIMTSTVSLNGSVDKGWTIQISPLTMEFTGPGTKRFNVDVIVPAGVTAGERGNVIITAECQGPILSPVKGTASSVITVINPSAAPEWDVRILDPAPNEVYDTDVLTISGSASYSQGAITSVEVKVCVGPWIEAEGTTGWSIDYDVSFLENGDHTIYVRARSGEDKVSATTEIIVIQDRSIGVDPPPPDPDTGEDNWKVYQNIIIGILILGGLGGVYLIYSRRQREEMTYLSIANE